MIYCFDLDDTLCKFVPGHYSSAKPYLDRIKKVNELYDQGHTIIIDTARGTMTGKDHSVNTARQLAKWGLKYHTLRTGIKFHATTYIDDKAINSEDFFK